MKTTTDVAYVLKASSQPSTRLTAYINNVMNAATIVLSSKSKSKSFIFFLRERVKDCAFSAVY